MSQSIDEKSFEDLFALDPEAVVQRTGCDYDEALQQYRVTVWGKSYCVDLKKNEIYPQGAGLQTYKGFIYLFILYYLIKSKNIKPSGVWVSEKDIPGGAGFFRGPHKIPSDVITQRFDDDIRAFERACEVFGGKFLNLADAAYSFQITPSIPVAVLYWQGDEDFPNEAKLLFDKTIEEHLPLDIVYSLAVEICNSFKA